MNLTLDQYIEGFERSARELPGVLVEWDGLDDELREAYADQLTWLLRVRADVLVRATLDDRFVDLAQRIAMATSVVFRFRQELEEKMAIRADQLVPHMTLASTGSDDQLFALAA